MDTRRRRILKASGALIVGAALPAWATTLPVGPARMCGPLFLAPAGNGLPQRGARPAACHWARLVL